MTTYCIIDYYQLNVLFFNVKFVFNWYNLSDYKVYNDEQLLVLIKEHSDHLAYTIIFERYNSLIFSHVYNKLRNQQEAEDVVQDIFVKFWAKRAEIDLRYKFPGYLFLLARNNVIDIVRKKKLSSGLENFYLTTAAACESTTDFLLREKQFEAIIEYEISLLPPRMREVFQLRRNYLSVKQISQQIGVTEATVATQIKKALKILRAKLKIVVFFILLLAGL